MKSFFSFSPKFFFRALFLVLAMATSVVFISCYTVPQTGRSSFNVLGPGEELKLGLSAFDEIKKKEKISTDSAKTAMVKRVGQRIANVADRDIPNARWEFVLFENEEPNAFALPGGKVGIHTGILPITKTEAGLAAVIGHEVAHVAARHAGERISEQIGLSAVGTAAGIALSGKGDRTRNAVLLGFGLGSTFGLVLPHNRMQESEADKIGLIYMAKAGYPPKEAVEFWKRFKEYNDKKGGRPPEFLSTHPADAQRIRNLEAQVEEAEVFYRTSGRK
jgi:metalloendopeptidase OMA1, mitochondrial